MVPPRSGHLNTFTFSRIRTHFHFLSKRSRTDPRDGSGCEGRGASLHEVPAWDPQVATVRRGVAGGESSCALVARSRSWAGGGGDGGVATDTRGMVSFLALLRHGGVQQKRRRQPTMEARTAPPTAPPTAARISSSQRGISGSSPLTSTSSSSSIWISFLARTVDPRSIDRKGGGTRLDHCMGATRVAPRPTTDSSSQRIFGATGALEPYVIAHAHGSVIMYAPVAMAGRATAG